MDSDLAKGAQEAFFDDDLPLALQLYSQAIDLEPNNQYFFADRAQVNIKLGNFAEAVADANKAIELDPTLAKAHLRKGMAYMKRGEYHAAKAALEAISSFPGSNSRFASLMDECDRHIAEERKGLTEPVRVSSANPVNVSSLKPNFRHEFYQKAEEIVVTIFAKGIPAKDVEVEFGEQILSVIINVPGQDAYHFQPRLFSKIIPEKCRYQVMSTKVEIRLAKAEDVQWTSLEYSSKDITVLQKLNAPSVQQQRPSYPSSKSRATDWDKLEAEVKKEEKEEKLEGDAGLNKLFRDMYLGGDENFRRAMNKSFVESNGTVLSTDWKEVGSKKIESSPPDGMQLRKWEH